MIILLKAEKNQIRQIDKETEILFDLPPLYFENYQTIFVNEITIKWKTSRRNISTSLHCTLIDKSPLNPMQQLLFVHQNYESNFLFYSPTRAQEYKIQRSTLQSAQFNLITSEKAIIQEVYIQLFISDARIQQIYQK